MSRILRARSSLWVPNQVKPQGIPKINWSHPLALGLISYWWDLGNGRHIDLVSGYTTILGSSVTIEPTKTSSLFGLGTSFTSNNIYTRDSVPFRIQSWAAPFSCAVGFYQRGATSWSQQPGWFGVADAVSNDPFFFYGPTSTTFGLSMGNVASSNNFTLSSNTFYVSVGAATGASAWSWWVNGIKQTDGSASTSYSGSNLKVLFGSSQDAKQTASPNAIVYFGAIWTRVLTETEAILLYNDPYCFLMPPEGEMPALFVPGAAATPFNQDDWPLSTPPAGASDLRTWIFQGGQPYLTGQDRLPIRQLDWPLPQPVTWRQDWSQNLAAKLLPPFRQQNWPLPILSTLPAQTWISPGGQIYLTGQDRLPIRQRDWPVQPPVDWRRDWSFNLQLTTPLRPFSQRDWPLSQPVTWYRDLATRGPLVGQDKIYAGPGQVPVYVWPVPQPISWSLGWTQNLLQSTLTPIIVKPFLQSDWPLPTSSTFALDLRTWTQRRGVLAPDDTHQPLPFDYGNPIIVSWYQSWTQNLLQTTLAPAVVASPFAQTDWSLPIAAAQPIQTFIAQGGQRYLTGKDKLPIRQMDWQNPVPVDWRRDWAQNLAAALQPPFRQNDWPLPIAAAQPIQVFIAQGGQRYLTGKDQLPIRQRDWVNPVSVSWYREWSVNLLESTLTPVIIRPFNQYEWPIPVASRQPIQTFVAQGGQRYLTGKDKLPVRQMDWPNPVPVIWYQERSVNLLESTLTPPPAPPVTGLPHNLPFLVTLGKLKSF